MAGTVVGQPPRKRLRIDDDPFGAVGDYAGSFLIKSAVEFSGGYDTNPGRLAAAQGKPFYVIAPEFIAVSDWERHALVADLRGSFTGYGSNLTPNADGTVLSAPLDIDRPEFHRPCRRPARRQPRHPPRRAGAAVRFDRQSRQPERAGGPRQISDLHHGRRHHRCRPDFQPAAGFRRRHRRPHRLYHTRNSPTAPRPPTTTATSASTAASAASAMICGPA